MLKRRLFAKSIVLLFTLALFLGLTPSSQAKSLVGSPCIKLNQQRGDGAGKVVICKQVGKKKLWQVYKKPVTNPKPSQSPSQIQPTTSSPVVSPSHSPNSNVCTKTPQFTEDFIDPKFVRVVTPIGEQTGSGGVIAVRSYIHPLQSYTGVELPIFAPTDLNLIAANYYKPLGSADTYQPEYSLYFEAGCGITVKFFHIKGVVGKVASVVPTTPSTSSAGQGVTSTAIKAGEQIGWYKLGENSVAFDFWVDNEAVTNKFIVQSHFVNSNAIHSVCPYDFYIPEKKSIWLGKLGAPGSNPVPGTTCGEISQGVPNTADGMWFISENTQTDNLVIDGAYQSQIMFSTDPSSMIRIGGLNANGGLAQMMISSNMATWKKPSDVKVGDSQCWSTPLQSVKVHVMSGNLMSVIVGTGTCEALGNPDSGRIYQR